MSPVSSRRNGGICAGNGLNSSLFASDYIFPLRDYPVREIELCCAQFYAVYQTHALKEAIIVEPDLYHTIPDCGRLRIFLSAFPFPLRYTSSGTCLAWPRLVWNWRRGIRAVTGGLPREPVRGFLIGMTGNIRGSGKDGEHLEASMPENVRGLLEPYRRGNLPICIATPTLPLLIKHCALTQRWGILPTTRY
jgi:hypothetical protein